MYNAFFGLDRRPFEISPDPDFLFDSEIHREVLACIDYAFEAGKGFILVTGEVGLGKTTLIRHFLSRLVPDKTTIVYVFHPMLDFGELLELIRDELGLRSEAGAETQFQLLRRIQRELIIRHTHGKTVVLVIDEAQQVPSTTLESLRLLSNLETTDAKLLQIILVGQPEFEKQLDAPELLPLAQRIGIKARLRRLSTEESIAYLIHRLEVAGAAYPTKILSRAAMARICKYAGGVPRMLNVLADLVLVETLATGKRMATTRIVDTVAVQNRLRVPTWRDWRHWRPLGLVAGLVVAVLAGILVVTLSRGKSTLPDRAVTATARVQIPNAQPQTPPPAPISPPTEQRQSPATPIDPAATPQPAPVQRAPVEQVASEPALPPSAPAAATIPEPAPIRAAEMPKNIAAPPPQTLPAPPAPAQTSATQTPTPQTASLPIPPPDLERETIVRVEPETNLLAICRRAYGADAQRMLPKVVARNALANPNLIEAGQTLILPAP